MIPAEGDETQYICMLKARVVFVDLSLQKSPLMTWILKRSMPTLPFPVLKNICTAANAYGI